MNLDLIQKSPDADDVRAALRERHGLAADAAVELKALPMDAERVDGDDYTFRARITTDTLDREGEVIIPEGVDASEFEKSGAIFWNHDYNQPIARHVKLIRGKGYIDAIARFAKRPDDFQGDFFPDFARAMVMQGVVKGVSVGFVPKEIRNPSKKDVETWGEGLRRVHSKSSLLEWSVAPVQCNPSAMVQMAVAKGIITREAARAAGVEVPEEAPAETIKSVAAAIDPEPEQQAPSVRVVAPRRKLYVVIPAAPPAPAAQPPPDVAGMVRRHIAKAAGRLYAD